MLKTIDVPKELKNFNSLFFVFQNKHDLSTVFHDLLTIIICCLSRETQEPLYFETIKRYDKKELQTFSQLFGELLLIYNENQKNNQWCDPLGDYYECLASNYKKSALGQFFTPKHICSVVAQLTLDPGNFGMKINEPCAGSGRMVLASNHIVKGNYYVCQDLDPICCKMTAINMCFHEIRGEVYCMDTIANTKPSFYMSINYEFWKHKQKVIFYYN